MKSLLTFFPDLNEDLSGEQSGGENGGSASDREPEPASSPEESKPNLCCTPDTSDPTPQDEESRFGLSKSCTDPEPKADNPKYSPEPNILIEGLSGSVSLPFSLRANRPPLEVLKKIFPVHKPAVLELILKGCGGDLVEPLRSCSPAVLQWNQKRFCLRTQILWFSPQTAISLSTRWLRTRSRLPSGRSVQPSVFPIRCASPQSLLLELYQALLACRSSTASPNRLDTPSCWEIHWAVAKPGPSCTTIWLCGIPWHYSSSISCAHSTSLRSQAPQPEWSAAHRSSPAGPPRSIESASRRRAVLSLPNRACLLQMRSMMKDLTPQTPGSWTLPPKSSAVWIAGWGKKSTEICFKWVLEMIQKRHCSSRRALKIYTVHYLRYCISYRFEDAVPT